MAAQAARALAGNCIARGAPCSRHLCIQTRSPMQQLALRRRSLEQTADGLCRQHTPRHTPASVCFASGRDSPSGSEREVEGPVCGGEDKGLQAGESMQGGSDVEEGLWVPVLASSALLQAVFALPAGAIAHRDFELRAYFESLTFPGDYIDLVLNVGGAAVFYLFIAPLIIYEYLRRRWFKKNMWETIFMFSLVFLFFPGLLLLGPFINFRPMPRTKGYPFLGTKN